MYVEVIPAKKELSGKSEAQKKKNVAAYCRVSTDTEEQAGSFEAQMQYYKTKIENTPNWTLVDVFGDEGISGVSDNRPEFQRMMEYCDKGKIDLILTKSVSRFSRNVSVTIDCVRKLREKGIGIIFEKENVNTLNYTSEMILGLHGIFAQAESESMSENIKLGKRFHYREGKVGFNFNRVFGYTQNQDEEISIDLAQAATVILIFDEFQNGRSLQEIARELQEKGMLSPSGKEQWSSQAVKRILTNEKYTGDVLTQKTYIIDPISKKTKKNTGELPQYLIKNHHIPIIEREQFDFVQTELNRRGCIRKNENKNEYMKYSGKFAFNNKIICGHCGTKFRRTMWKQKNQDKYVWRCLGRMDEGKDYCPDSPSIDDEFLKSAAVSAINIIYSSKSRVKDVIKCSISALLGNREQPLISENNKRLEESEQKIRDALYKNATGEISTEELDLICMEVMTESKKLRQENMKYEMAQKLKNAQTSALKQIFSAIDEMKEELEEYDPDLVRKIIEKIEVHSSEKATIWFVGEIPFEISLPER